MKPCYSTSSKRMVVRRRLHLWGWLNLLIYFRIDFKFQLLRTWNHVESWWDWHGSSIWTEWTLERLYVLNSSREKGVDANNRHNKPFMYQSSFITNLFSWNQNAYVFNKSSVKVWVENKNKLIDGWAIYIG